MRKISGFTFFLAICGMMLVSGTRGRNLPPATQPAAAHPAAADEDQLLISKMRVQDFPVATYYYASTQTTLTAIGPTVQETIPKVIASFEENQVKPIGPMTFVYQGVDGTPNKEFTLEIGFPVAKGSKDAGDYKVRELPAFHCATVVYSGPVAEVRQAYMQVFTDIAGAGLKPTGETREMYLYWESPESPNNIELIMIGVEP